MGIRWLYPVRRNRGFTLIETALAVVIVGVGFTAAMALYTSCTSMHNRALRVVTAAQLANNLREIIYKTPGYGAIDLASSSSCLNGATFCPPVIGCSSRFLTLPINVQNGWTFADGTPPLQCNLSQYTQTIAVTKVSAADMRNTSTTDTGLKRVTVTITFKSTPTSTPETVYILSFLICNLT